MKLTYAWLEKKDRAHLIEEAPDRRLLEKSRIQSTIELSHVNIGKVEQRQIPVLVEEHFCLPRKDRHFFFYRQAQSLVVRYFVDCYNIRNGFKQVLK